MKCPGCGHSDSKVMESRDLDDGSTIRRRRQCLECECRFTTYERVETPMVLVVKRDGHRELFNREKLSAGVYRALEKRPVGVAEIEEMISQIERDVRSGSEPEIASSQIGGAVMSKLLAMDEVAYVRFASVYRSFDCIDNFADELKKIRRGQNSSGSKL